MLQFTSPPVDGTSRDCCEDLVDMPELTDPNLQDNMKLFVEWMTMNSIVFKHVAPGTGNARFPGFELLKPHEIRRNVLCRYVENIRSWPTVIFCSYPDGKLFQMWYSGEIDLSSVPADAFKTLRITGPLFLF